MSVLVELHNTGDATIRTEVQVIVEHVLSDRPGEWRVSIVGSRAKEDWEMKVEGPNGFERSYTLVGTAGEHQPVAIGNLLLRLLPSKTVINTVRVRPKARSNRTPPRNAGFQ